MKIIYLLLWAIFSPCFAANLKEDFLQKYRAGIPHWMQVQAEQDLSSYTGPISLRKLCDYYESSSAELYIIKISIINNEVSFDYKGLRNEGIDYRLWGYKEALRVISETVGLPDTVILLSMHDAFSSPNKETPVFSMCRRVYESSILVPDFEALRERFQVLPKRDLTKYEPRWETKKDLLVWRGSTAQASLDGELMRSDNIDRFSRVILCKLSQEYPELIDARFTFFAQGGEKVPALQAFKADQMPFEKMIQYKYQLFVDGNVSPYSASGWKFFSNSLVFKADSPCVQWYFGVLKPYEHYVPVKADLSDLVEKIRWAQHNESVARTIAKKCREFAVSHLTLSDNLLYLKYIIERYSQLGFVE